MKQIFYGPTGFGKSHIILHGLKRQSKLVIITTNGLKNELENVGLKDVPVNAVQMSVQYAKKQFRRGYHYTGTRQCVVC